MYNLIEERWIPVKCESGNIRKIAPWEIVDDSDVPLEVCHSRPDFNSCLTQFLIALLQTVSMPKDDIDWMNTLESGIDMEELHESMKKVAGAFNLFDDKMPFMQDTEFKKDDLKDISGILLTNPCGNTLKLNKDFFIKRLPKEGRLCASCAAAALVELQFLAPMGGSGIRSSVRGSSPMTVMACGDNLWETVWLNVLSRERITKTGGNNPDASPFPWVGDFKENINPEGNNPVMIYWATVRRVMLDSLSEQCDVCDVCGSTERCVHGYYEVNRGTEYRSWLHPLAPVVAKDESNLYHQAIKPSTRHFNKWYSIVYTVPGAIVPPMPISSISYNRELVKEILGKTYSVWLSGFENQQAIPKTWVDARIPVYLNMSGAESVFLEMVSDIVKVSEMDFRSLTGGLKTVLGDKNVNSTNIGEVFWTDCDTMFLDALSEFNGDNSSDILKEWIDSMRGTVLRIFDDQSDSIPMGKYGVVSKARNNLFNKASEKYIMKGLKKNE